MKYTHGRADLAREHGKLSHVTGEAQEHWSRWEEVVTEEVKSSSEERPTERWT
jgi:hypothetical protein